MQSKFIAVLTAFMLLFSFFGCDEKSETQMIESITYSHTEKMENAEQELIPEEVLIHETETIFDEAEHIIEAVNSPAPSVIDTESVIIESIPSDIIPEVVAETEAEVIAEPEQIISSTEDVASEVTADASNCDYILNTNSMKMHYPSCSSVKSMAAHNTSYFIGTRDEAIALGYNPCGRCKP